MSAAPQVAPAKGDLPHIIDTPTLTDQSLEVILMNHATEMEFAAGFAELLEDAIEGPHPHYTPEAAMASARILVRAVRQLGEHFASTEAQAHEWCEAALQQVRAGADAGQILGCMKLDDAFFAPEEASA